MEELANYTKDHSGHPVLRMNADILLAQNLNCMVQQILSNFAEKRRTVVVDVGSKFLQTSTLLGRFLNKCQKMWLTEAGKDRFEELTTEVNEEKKLVHTEKSALNWLFNNQVKVTEVVIDYWNCKEYLGDENCLWMLTEDERQRVSLPTETALVSNWTPGYYIVCIHAHYLAFEIEEDAMNVMHLRYYETMHSEDSANAHQESLRNLTGLNPVPTYQELPQQGFSCLTHAVSFILQNIHDLDFDEAKNMINSRVKKQFVTTPDPMFKGPEVHFLAVRPKDTVYNRTYFSSNLKEYNQRALKFHEDHFCRLYAVHEGYVQDET